MAQLTMAHDYRRGRHCATRIHFVGARRMRAQKMIAVSDGTAAVALQRGGDKFEKGSDTRGVLIYMPPWRRHRRGGGAAAALSAVVFLSGIIYWQTRERQRTPSLVHSARPLSSVTAANAQHIDQLMLRSAQPRGMSLL